MRGALHFLLRVGPDFYLSRRGPHPRRCCSAHARLATAQGCHALTPSHHFLMLAGPHPRSPRSRIRTRSSRGRCARASSLPPLLPSPPTSPPTSATDRRSG